MTSVLQPWVEELTMMKQTVLLSAIRGPDGVEKYDPSKLLLRWYRRCVLRSALLRGGTIDNPYDQLVGGSFMGPSITLPADRVELWPEMMQVDVVGSYLRVLDMIPHHFQLHLLHGAEIIGYKHPVPLIRGWWHRTYLRLVSDMHLFPETEGHLDLRLGDDREAWASRTDEALRD